MGQPHLDGLKAKLGSCPTRRGMSSRQAKKGGRGAITTLSPFFLTCRSPFRSQLKTHLFRKDCPDPRAKPQPSNPLLYFLALLYSKLGFFKYCQRTRAKHKVVQTDVIQKLQQ